MEVDGEVNGRRISDGESVADVSDEGSDIWYSIGSTGDGDDGGERQRFWDWPATEEYRKFKKRQITEPPIFKHGRLARDYHIYWCIRPPILQVHPVRKALF